MLSATRQLSVLATVLTLAMASAHAQTIVPQNLGGGCGGTVGYPALRQGSNTLLFRVQRQVCDPNAFATPSVLMVGLQTTSFPIPFGPGMAPGCHWSVVPDAVLPIPGTVGGAGISVWLGDASGVPPGTVIHMQALVTCVVHGSRESAVSDGWRLRFQ